MEQIKQQTRKKDTNKRSTMTGTVTMTKVKDCVHSTPFKTENPDAPVQTVYIRKSHQLGKDLSVTQSWDENTVTFSVGA